MQEKQGIHRPDVFQTHVTALVDNSFPDLHAGLVRKQKIVCKLIEVRRFALLALSTTLSTANVICLSKLSLFRVSEQ